MMVIQRAKNSTVVVVANLTDKGRNARILANEGEKDANVGTATIQTDETEWRIQFRKMKYILWLKHQPLNGLELEQQLFGKGTQFVRENHVMVKTNSPTLFLLLLTTSTVLASICPKHQYLNAQQQRCMNCTECSQGTIVLLPCELHRDTHCGPISDLSELLVENSGNPHRHHHDRHRHEKHRNKEGELVWRYGEDVRGDAPSPAALEVASSEAPFSSAETLVWDWQAIALTSAVFACILFFLVITLYSLHQARQWRRLKENFEAGK
ncbi:hypothetical protein HUJ05_000487 [Dendroctonus ponderosae]|nr:hypothetical protein HUJ05_000487 [Dendroctonus ponderosae]